MNTGHKAIFAYIDKDDMRNRLRKIGALLEKKEVLMKIINFNFPSKIAGIKETWFRISDEKGKITMSLKAVNDENDENNAEIQREAEMMIDDMKSGVGFLEALGAKKKSYQEIKREIWKIDDITVLIDEWPFLEAFLEIRGAGEKDIEGAASWIGLDYSLAKFCAEDELYAEKYSISKDIVNKKIGEITFDMKNPFVG